MRRFQRLFACLALSGFIALLGWSQSNVVAQQDKKEKKKKAAAPVLEFPPKLPGGKEMVTDKGEVLLKSTTKLVDGVVIAKEAPTIDFAYIPGQTYAGKIWSVWGDSLFAKGKYYTAFGDHDAPGGNAFVYEYDPGKKSFRLLCDVKKVLDLKEGMYVPGKIHTTLTMGSDGWIYFATHRGSTGITSTAQGYNGDWIIRCHPETAKAEIVVEGVVNRHSIPTGIMDPQRLIFYAGTAPPTADKTAKIHFFAYDVKNRKVLCDVEDGPSRALILSKSTGRVWYNESKTDKLVRWDPAKGGAPVEVPGLIGLRCTTEETADGFVYTAENRGKDGDVDLYKFNVKTEAIEKIGPLQVGVNMYITSLDIDPSGRFIYYIPGAHGGADKDGSPVVQYDLKTKTRKVICFLHPFYKETYGVAPVGTYSVALSDKGDALFVTWNSNRGSKAWDCCALSVIHIPESERK
jgi:hypothetical protein